MSTLRSKGPKLDDCEIEPLLNVDDEEEERKTFLNPGNIVPAATMIAQLFVNQGTAGVITQKSTRKVGCFARLKIYEENARFILLSIVVFVYLLLGATIFRYLERDQEILERELYNQKLAEIRRRMCPDEGVVFGPKRDCNVAFDELVNLIREGAAAGLSNVRPRFDFYGSLFFSGTIISTIGFGSSTPRTILGRLVTIIYGLFGCTCCVLFFNLCLERFITALSYLLRYIHEQKLKQRARHNANGNKPVTLLINDEVESASSCAGVHDAWRPSVYKVFFCLISFSSLLLSLAALLYSHTEDWNYVDALYFCFTSFATIGFGDFVSNQNTNKVMNEDVYGIINFLLLTIGACCFYCLFNVSSIVVRQLLNWVIKKLDVKVDNGFCCFRTRRSHYVGLGLRPPKGFDCASSRASVDCPDGLLSLKEFLFNQQISVVMLQKHLLQSATKNAQPDEEQKISASRIGPMGILDEAFGSDQVDE